MTDTLRPAETAVLDAAPAETGNPKTLKRSIGVVGGTLLTLSCVTPASTLFVVIPDLFGSLGTATALTIAIGSLLCVAVAFCYSELGTLIPSAGGEYAMVSTMAGRLAGWLVFVMSLLVVMIVPPVIAIGTADYLALLVHLDPAMTGAGVMLLATSPDCSTCAPTPGSPASFWSSRSSPPVWWPCWASRTATAAWAA